MKNKMELFTEKMMTTKEIAAVLGISERTIQRVAKKCFPTKIIEHGKPAIYSKAEVTVMIDRIQHNNNNQHHITATAPVGVATTDLTPALMIKQAMELAQRGYELELQRIEAEKQKIEKERDNLQIELDESKEWYSIKRMEKLNKGRHFDWRLLKKESERMGVKIHKVFDANYEEVNAYHVSVWESLFFDTLNYGE